MRRLRLRSSRFLQELFHNNRIVCKNIKESQVRKFVRMIVERGQSVRHLLLLQVFFCFFPFP